MARFCIYLSKSIQGDTKEIHFVRFFISIGKYAPDFKERLKEKPPEKNFSADTVIFFPASNKIGEVLEKINEKINLDSFVSLGLLTYVIEPKKKLATLTYYFPISPEKIITKKESRLSEEELSMLKKIGLANKIEATTLGELLKSYGSDYHVVDSEGSSEERRLQVAKREIQEEKLETREELFETAKLKIKAIERMQKRQPPKKISLAKAHQNLLAKSLRDRLKRRKL